MKRTEQPEDPRPLEERPILEGRLRVVCTGNGTHKAAQLAYLRMIRHPEDGQVYMHLGEGGSSWNLHNSRGLDGERKMQPALWPLVPEAGEGPSPGASMTSYRFVCDRCRRDVRIDETKLRTAADAMLIAGYRTFDLSRLPFA